MTKHLIDRDKAFEMYYALGTSRSLTILYKKMSRRCKGDVPTARTLKSWSCKYNWQDRVLLRDNAVREGVREAATAVVVEAKIKELDQLDTAYSEIEAVKPMIVTALQSKQAAKIIPETTPDITSLYNALSRLYSVQVKIVEVARKIRGESDKVEIEFAGIEYVLTKSE
jgi:hypothetical protein